MSPFVSSFQSIMPSATSPHDSEITLRVARYAYDRLTFAGPSYAVGVGTAVVWLIGAWEGRFWTKNDVSWITKTSFAMRYATYNVIPSLTWGTQAPEAIVKSSRYLSAATESASWLHTTTSLPPPRNQLYIKMLSSLRGATAGSVVLSNVIALTSLWQRARSDYADRISKGREPPLQTSSASKSKGCTVRLAGVHSDVTELSMMKSQSSIWPIFEDPSQPGVKRLVALYGYGNEHRERAGSTARPYLLELLPRIPVFWQVRDGEYSKRDSWDGMTVPKEWLYRTKSGQRLLYLEADATSGDNNALSLQQNSHYYQNHELHKRRSWLDWIGLHGHHRQPSMPPLLNLDLDLKECAQGFRRLAELAHYNNNNSPDLVVIRVLLVDPTVIIESGGGRRTSVRDHVEELRLADVIVDARESVLHSMLSWLWSVYDDPNTNLPRTKLLLKPVVLETASKAWFRSIKSELIKHGYDVLDRKQAETLFATKRSKTKLPMMVYERSSADTVHTILQYLEQGIVDDPSRICALLTCHEGLEEMEMLNTEYKTGRVGCICSSAIHDKALEWVRRQCVAGVPIATIQQQLDDGVAWQQQDSQ